MPLRGKGESGVDTAHGRAVNAGSEMWGEYKEVSKIGLAKIIASQFDESWAKCVESWSILEWLYRVSRTLLPDPRDTDVTAEPNRSGKPATCLAAEAIQVLNAEYLDLDVATLERLLPDTTKKRPPKKSAKKRIIKEDERKAERTRMKKVMEDAGNYKDRLESKLKRLEGTLQLAKASYKKRSSPRSGQSSPKPQKPTDWRDFMLLKSIQRLYTAWESWRDHYSQLHERKVKCGDLNQTIGLLKSVWLPAPSSPPSATSVPEMNLELMCRTYHEWKGKECRLGFEIPSLLGEKRHTHQNDNEPAKGVASLLQFKQYKAQADYLRTMEKMLELSMDLCMNTDMLELCSSFNQERQKFEQHLQFPTGSKEGNTLKDLADLKFTPPLQMLRKNENEKASYHINLLNMYSNYISY
jgi:hypothetical protein